jgi:hypothetical protein
MPYSAILDISIGLIFTYLLFSLLCSVITEWIAAGLGSRAQHLQQAIAKLITDPGERAAFIGHPLIKSLCQNGKKILNELLSNPVDGPPTQAATFLTPSTN